MKPFAAAEKRRILIVDPDVQFQQRLHNFFLSAGYEWIDSVESFDKALEKIDNAKYDVMMLDVASHSNTVRLAKRMAELSPQVGIILMITGEDRRDWKGTVKESPKVHFLLKATFERNLLHLLETL